MRMLQEPALASQAAGVLAAAAQADLLSQAQIDTTLQRIRQRLAVGQQPDPHTVALLGLDMGPDDTPRILAWLDHPDDALREAAARVWARSDRSPQPLAERAHDVVIQPLAIAAATDRGSRPATLLALLTHQPDHEQTRQSWQQALLAMAQRVPLTAARDAARQLAALGSPPSFRQAFLSRALAADREADSELPAEARVALAEMLLHRAALALQANETQAAEADLTRMEGLKATLSPALQQMHHAARLRLSVLQDDHEAALNQARQLLAVMTSNASTDAGIASAERQAVLSSLILAAERAAGAGRADGARQLVRLSIRLAGDALPQALQDRLDKLRVQLDGETPPTGS